MKKIEPLADEELEFLKQLFSSNVPITISAAHIVVNLKTKIEHAEEVVGKEISDPVPDFGP